MTSEPTDEPPFEALPPMAAFPSGSPPRSIEVEEALISCVFLDDGETASLAQTRGITGRTFTADHARLFWETGEDILARHEPVNGVTIATVLQLSGRLTPELAQHIFRITKISPTTATAPSLIDALLVFERRRDAIQAANILIRQAQDPTAEFDEAMADARRRLAPPNPKGSATLTVWTPAELRAYVPPMNYALLGDGFLMRQELTTLIGPPGIGKSRLSTWLAISHITGRQFLDLPTHNHPARWLMIGNEDSRTRQKTDLEWFYKNLTAEDQALVDANLFTHVLANPEDGVLDLGDPDTLARIQATLTAIKPDVVRFDPWANMIAGDENDTQDTRDSVRRLLSLMRRYAPEAALLVVHHARTGVATVSQAGSRYSAGSLGRGSKVLVGAARCELALWPGDREDPDKLVLTCEKCNNAKPFEPIGIIFQNGIYIRDPSFDPQAWRDDIEGKRSTKTVTIEDIIETVKGGRSKFKDIVEFLSESTGASKVTIVRRIKDSVSKGWLVKTIPAGSYTIPTKKPTSKPYKDDEPDDKPF